jgi:hypothetical protein
LTGLLPKSAELVGPLSYLAWRCWCTRLSCAKFKGVKYLLVFALSVILDYVWGSYIKHTANGAALPSATYAAVLVAMSSLMTILYVGDHWLVIPASAGAFVGTLVVHKKAA